MRTLFDIAGLQLTWWVCALGAASGQWWPGTLVALVIIAVQVVLSTERTALLAAVFAAGAIGTAGESLLVMSELVRFATPSPAILAAPVWLVALWLSFGTGIGPMRRALGRHATVKGAMLGAISGPPTYWAGQRLGALELVAPLWPALVAVGVLWAVAMALLLLIDRRCAAV